MVILRYIAERIGSGKLVISTLASGYADEVWEIYRTLFTSMGVKSVKRLCMDHRDESLEDPRLDVLADATAVFFTGGDQLRITTRMGGTALSERTREATGLVPIGYWDNGFRHLSNRLREVRTPDDCRGLRVRLQPNWAHEQLFRDLLSFMMEDPGSISRAMRLLFVSKNLERIGDHATNIAEMVIFLVRGQSIRHMDKKPRQL